MRDKRTYEVIIIGGSYAGLSAAMALGRSLRKALIIDAGAPCNISTPHSHNFLTQDGKTPIEISQIARTQLAGYESISFHDGLVEKGQKSPDGFEVETANGEIFYSDKLIIATGIKDLLPDIPGFRDCWGKTIIHCPYCHGYEFRNEKTAITTTPDTAMHMVPLIRNLTDDLTVLAERLDSFTTEERQKLDRNGIALREYTLASVRHQKGQVQRLHFTDGTAMELNVLYAPLPFAHHTDLAEQLGCEFTESGHIQVDHFQKTTVSGVFACGDNASPMRSVANAVATGNVAGAALNMELANEVFVHA